MVFTSTLEQGVYICFNFSIWFHANKLPVACHNLHRSIWWHVAFIWFTYRNLIGSTHVNIVGNSKWVQNIIFWWRFKLLYLIHLLLTQCNGCFPCVRFTDNRHTDLNLVIFIIFATLNSRQLIWASLRFNIVVICLRKGLNFALFIHFYDVLHFMLLNYLLLSIIIIF